ncbi:hypothetical protein TIFTF001_037242 [Ficus carica]|uniref:Uncharacterized protein n=1 Tax=Ficus carica TaxID=3494 RepID=A0AA88E5S9_FICCA|nr:hypothetical protein TIFTF001_037242 [Ficus carica]
MEFSMSYSSLRLPATIPSQCYKASSSFTRSIPVKATKSSNLPSKCSTNINLNLPVGLYGENKLSKSLLFDQNKRDSIRAFAQAESGDAEPVNTKATDDSVYARASRFGAACYTFIRPYAIRQALISSVCLYARVLNENQLVLQWPLWLKAFPGLIAIFFAHAYENGINQVFDIDIDRINKPYLPLSSGELSLKHAWLMMSFGVLSGLLIFRLCNADLISTALYCLGLLLATSYSAPPFRFKGSSLATIMVIPMINFIKSVGILYTANASLGRPFVWSSQTIFIVAFSTIFFVAGCPLKDIPDVKGDMKNNIRTFAARFGAKNIVYFAVGLLLVNYIGAIAAAILLPQAFKRSVMLPVHIFPALMLLFQARKLDKANYGKEQSANFFQFLWLLLLLNWYMRPRLAQPRKHIAIDGLVSISRSEDSLSPAACKQIGTRAPPSSLPQVSFFASMW